MNQYYPGEKEAVKLILAAYRSRVKDIRASNNLIETIQDIIDEIEVVIKNNIVSFRHKSDEWAKVIAWASQHIDNQRALQKLSIVEKTLSSLGSQYGNQMLFGDKLVAAWDSLPNNIQNKIYHDLDDCRRYLRSAIDNINSNYGN